MRLEPATNNEIRRITKELEFGKSRPKSSDFLEGFPWGSVAWHKVILELAEFENLFLFWTGSAWGETTHMPPRRLKDGVRAFRHIDSQKSSNLHLEEVKRWVTKCQTGTFRFGEPFLILGGQDQHSRLLILDGNHRAAAVLWWTIQSAGRGMTPTKGWLGLSPDMKMYRYYQLTFQTR